MKKFIPCKPVLVVFAMLFAFAFSSCHKEGLGGNGSIAGKVAHHGKAIPNCVVYLKFNTQDFPGESPSNYDANVTADANGEYTFPKLYKGDYYLYGIGFDNSINQVVRGGVPVKVKRNKQTTQDVPVTED
jgi:hypothetical protein